MTVEIRELVIRAVATLTPADSAETADFGEDDSDAALMLQQSALYDREALIQECVHQVLRILQRAKDR